jgi:hypothetical protein
MYQNDVHKMEVSAPFNLFLGYFQTFDYEESILLHVKSELEKTLESRVGKDAKSLVGQVSVHIRGTDFKKFYLENPIEELTHNYYLDALERSRQMIEESHIVLTDDLEYASEVIGEHDKLTFVGPEDMSVYDVLYVMSKSRIFISSSSTLSIWGALLASSNDGEIYMPKTTSVMSIVRNCSLFKSSKIKLIEQAEC